MTNEMPMGSIPGYSGGIRKTYEESLLFIDVDSRILTHTLRSGIKREKLYLNDEDELVLESERYNYYKGKYREVEILGMYCYGININTTAIEVIDKSILHEHLEQEREMRLRLKR